MMKSQGKVKISDNKKKKTKNFPPITLGEIANILGKTIKEDNVNKVITFLTQLTAYTEESQLNLSFNGLSATGKSFQALEISKLFPQEDVIKLGSCSATAFYHEQGVYDKERNVIKVDLARKIIIFLDQPSNTLLTRLRALLSHDDKEIQAKITDKNQKGGNRTKTVVLIGFPVVIFCTTGLKIDEQEATRFLLLSPDTDHLKLWSAIQEKIIKESDVANYKNEVEKDPKRKSLIARIRAIKNAQIKDVIIDDVDKVISVFFQTTPVLKPRHTRDVGRIISLIKSIALLNLWSRERRGQNIVAHPSDISQAFDLYRAISKSQELNLPPYVYDIFMKIFYPVFKKRNGEYLGGVTFGITKQEVFDSYFEFFGQRLPDWQFRQEIIPMLEAAGLIREEQDPEDRRKIIYYPTVPLTISDPNNSPDDSNDGENHE